MKAIGVTGGVGCGKSEILRQLQHSCVCDVIRTDDVANDLKEPGGACYDAIVAMLGEDVLEAGKGSRIDRAKMAEKIFGDEALLKKVNDLLHPAVRQVVIEKLEAEDARGILDVMFIEAALLLECGYASESTREAIEKASIPVNKAYGITLDEMWYVYAPQDVRRKRLKEHRGYSDEKIDGIMQKQLSEEQFRAGSDFVIDNGGSLADALAQAKERLKLV